MFSHQDCVQEDLSGERGPIVIPHRSREVVQVVAEAIALASLTELEARE
jgi:hypothetical protein